MERERRLTIPDGGALVRFDFGADFLMERGERRRSDFDLMGGAVCIDTDEILQVLKAPSGAMISPMYCTWTPQETAWRDG